MKVTGNMKIKKLNYVFLCTKSHDMIMRHTMVGDSGSILDQMGFFDVHPMYGILALLHFAYAEMQQPWPEFDTVSSGLVAQCQTYYTTRAGKYRSRETLIRYFTLILRSS